MKQLILVEVPIDSENYYINNVGCLRYSHDNGRQSSCIEPMAIGEYLESGKHEIIGATLFKGIKIVVIQQIEN